jgi:hypothetical protein
VTYVEGGKVRRNIEATQLRKVLLEALEIPLIEPRRDLAAIKEETDVTIS